MLAFCAGILCLPPRELAKGTNGECSPPSFAKGRHSKGLQELASQSIEILGVIHIGEALDEAHFEARLAGAQQRRLEDPLGAPGDTPKDSGSPDRQADEGVSSIESGAEDQIGSPERKDRRTKMARAEKWRVGAQNNAISKSGLKHGVKRGFQT